MRRASAAATVLAALVMLCGCAGAGEPAVGLPATVTSGGVYEGGVDLEPGVYVADARECYATTARTREFTSDSDDFDDLISNSARIGDVNRIAVGEGEFFRPGLCSEWALEDSSGPRLPDPATRAGACTVLTEGEDLVQQVVDALEADPRTEESTGRGYELQDRLMAVVFAQAPGLWPLAGELVDFLDVPDAFVGEDGKVSPRVRAVREKIEARCRG